MRALFLCYVVFLVSGGFGLVGEMNQMHYDETGYYLIPYDDTMYLNASYEDQDFSQKVDEYGLNRIPSQAGSNYFLGTGGQQLATGNSLIDIFLMSTIGFGDFVVSYLPSLPSQISVLIGGVVFLNNMIVLLVFIRGVYISIWGR